MNRITLLDQITIDQIAAGEVIERPSSVVKELVENAIDAQASAVTVEIRGGGISCIRITDNGTGISKDEIPLAFCRHATSKITSLDDLRSVSSLGFRGEALSSIAAVSQVELITKVPDCLMGTRYVIEGGQEKRCEEIGAPEGTTFLIRNLFYNTPARAKFLKSPATEGSWIGTLLEQLAMSRSDIAFTFIQNGQRKLLTSGNGKLKDVIYQVYGRGVAGALLSAEAADDGSMKLDGYIGKPEISRGNRGFEHYYVNGRYVKNPVVTRAIEDAFRPYLMQHRFPFTALFLTMDPELLDVNVHPSKKEVRFQDADAVYRFVCRSVGELLAQKELIPEVSFDPVHRKTEPSTDETQTVPEPFEVKRREKLAETFVPDVPVMNREAPDSQIHENPSSCRSEQLSLFKDTRFLSENAKKRHQIIGQVFGTFWLVEMDDKLFIIDQHAAHEKVMYEKLLARFSARDPQPQYLAVPLVITLNLRQMELLHSREQLFRDFGFDLEPFGEKEYVVRTVPSGLYGIDDRDLVTELIDELDDGAPEDGLPALLAEKLASKSCRAAIKGNQRLSLPEARQLIDDLLALDNPYHCPHGRPTIISMSRYELEKKFKRIL